MKTVDWQAFHLGETILREPSPDKNRMVLWLPAGQQGGQRLWQRIGNVPGAAPLVVDSLCTMAASSILVRQRRSRFLSWLFNRSSQDDARTWTLPNGRGGEQEGERENDWLLVWSSAEMHLHEGAVQAHWPHGMARRLGANLFLVRARADGTPAEPVVPESERQQAEAILAIAQQAGDRHGEMLALADIGLALRREGQVEQAITTLEQALRLAQDRKDRAAETDIVGNLGLAYLAARRVDRATEHLQRAMSMAVASGSPFEQKTALDNLAKLHSYLGRFERANGLCQQALDLARQVGDAEHEASLLWSQAVQRAEQGNADDATSLAEESIRLLKDTGPERATKLACFLKKYREGEVQTLAVLTAEPDRRSAGGAFDVGSHQGLPPAPNGPGLLRMAFSAAKSMARFLGAGMKTTEGPTRQKRLAACGSCEHHTGLRCKLCGCFTKLKTLMPHEKCPIGKW